MKDYNRLEKDILKTYQLPDANPEFINRLEKAFESPPIARTTTALKPTHKFSRGWGYAAITLLLLLALLFAIGPTKVLAQIQSLLGYIPDVGVVDTSYTFYQLDKSVSDTKDGITLTIEAAFLSADQTIITFSISDLPLELRPIKFGDPVCNTPAYLTLPDGSEIQSSHFSTDLQATGTYKHLVMFNNPENTEIKQATLIFPCLEGVVLGEGPMDWQFDLVFIPAPEDLEIFPVSMADLDQPVELEPEVQTTLGLDEIETSEENALAAMLVDGERQEEMTLLGVADKGDSYWVTWAYPMPRDPDIQVNGFLLMIPFNPALYDANGVEQPPADLELRNELWDYQDSLLEQLPDEDQLKYAGIVHTFAIPKTGFAFPAYIKLNALERSLPEKEQYAEIQFDGTAVQNSNGPVPINQAIQIGDIEFELVAIEKGEYGGYTFNFDGAQGEVIDCRVELVGHPTDTSGQSSLVADDPFHFYQSLIYSSPPTGELTVRIDLPVVLDGLITLIGAWSPNN